MFSFTPREGARGTQWIRGLVGPRAGLDCIEKWKFLTLPSLQPRHCVKCILHRKMTKSFQISGAWNFYIAAAHRTWSCVFFRQIVQFELDFELYRGCIASETIKLNSLHSSWCKLLLLKCNKLEGSSVTVRIKQRFKGKGSIPDRSKKCFSTQKRLDLLSNPISLLCIRYPEVTWPWCEVRDLLTWYVAK